MPQRPPIHRPQHAPARVADHLIRGSAASRGYDSQWRRFRREFLQANPICCFRDDPRHHLECATAATIVDHVTPLAAGGPKLDKRNCRPVCRVAHQEITENFKRTGVNELPARGWTS